MVYGKCQEAITHFSPREGGGLGIGELMIAGAGAGAVTSFVLYVYYLYPSLPLASSYPSTDSTPTSFILSYYRGITDQQDTDRIDQM